MNAIELMFKGIKCDNQTCDYEDPTAEFNNYKSYLNKPCPECNSNLLTQQDLDMVLALVAVAKNVNSNVDPKDINNLPRAIYSIEMNGSGKVNPVFKGIYKNANA